MKDSTILWKISQGMYVLTTKGAGCCVDAVSQISAGDNPLIAVSVMKKNYTNELLRKNNKFALSVLGEQVNPEIIKTSGSEIAQEGCLSVPGKYGTVQRPTEVTVKATDRDGNEFEMTGYDLLARALCHEIDHLDGTVFVDKVIEYIED